MAEHDIFTALNLLQDPEPMHFIGCGAGPENERNVSEGLINYNRGEAIFPEKEGISDILE